MRKLFLDDIRIPKDCANGLVPVHLNKFYWMDDWNIVRDFDQFINWIEDNGMPDFISFDHDLGDIHYTMSDFTEYYKDDNREMTGFDCAKWMIEYCIDRNLRLPDFYVHSQNPVGKENIICYIDNAKRFLGK